MNGLRRPYDRPRRFVALPTPDLALPVILCSRFRASPNGGFHSATEFLVIPASLTPGCLGRGVAWSSQVPVRPSCLIAMVLDPAAVCQTVRLRLSHSARAICITRASGLRLSELDCTAFGSLPTLPRFDCSTRARLASDYSDLLCRAGSGSRRPARSFRMVSTSYSRCFLHSQAYPVASGLTRIFADRDCWASR